MSNLIVTQGLTKRFDGLVAVNNVDFHAEERQVSGVIGPNGSGKTTLFNLLSGLFAPSEGTIIFQGQNITATSPNKRVEMGMARTFQLVSVFNSLTTWQNLVLSSIKFRKDEQSLRNFFFRPAQKKSVFDKCREALKMVGLQEKLFIPTSELSYGDKRMIEIAIAISLRPKLLLLDEPFSGLSDHEIGEVLGLLNRVKKEFTLIIIEHKISKIVDLVDKLTVINDGSIICEGEPNQVLCDPLVRECYWGKEGDSCLQ